MKDLLKDMRISQEMKARLFDPAQNQLLQSDIDAVREHLATVAAQQPRAAASAPAPTAAVKREQEATENAEGDTNPASDGGASQEGGALDE